MDSLDSPLSLEFQLMEIAETKRAITLQGRPEGDKGREYALTRYLNLNGTAKQFLVQVNVELQDDFLGAEIQLGQYAERLLGR